MPVRLIEWPLLILHVAAARALDLAERADPQSGHRREGHVLVETNLRAEAQAGFEGRFRELDLAAAVLGARTAPADRELGDKADAIRIGGRANADSPKIRVAAVGLGDAAGDVAATRAELGALPNREHVVVTRQARARVELEHRS